MLLSNSDELNKAIDEFKNIIIQETLTEDFYINAESLSFEKTVQVEGFELKIELEKK